MQTWYLAGKRLGMAVLFFVSLLLAGCGEKIEHRRSGGVGAPDLSGSSQLDSVSEPAGLRLVPQVERLNVDETGSVEIRLDNAGDLYGLHLSIKFDPQVLQVKDGDLAQEGIQIVPGSLPFPDFAIVNRADNEQGVVEYAVTQLNPRKPAQGDGKVAVIHFYGVGAGVSSLAFSYTKLADPDGREVPVRFDNTTLEVNQPNSARRIGVGWIQD